MVPYALTYYVRETGRLPRVVRCEQCDREYVYFLKRAGEGEGTSLLFLENAEAKERAARKARAELEAALAVGVDPVPCPRCGWYQAHMVPEARSRRHPSLWYVAGLGLMVAIIFGAIAIIVPNGHQVDPDFARVARSGGWVGVAGAVLAVGAWAWRWRLAGLYDPNDAPAADRVAVGQAKAMTIERFSELLAAYEESRSRLHPDDADAAEPVTPSTPDPSPRA
jgi:hypothetical protein